MSRNRRRSGTPPATATKRTAPPAAPSPPRRRRARPSALLWVVPAVAAAAVAAWLLVPRSPSAQARRGWRAAGADRPNVLIVTMDTTRADHLGCYGYDRIRTPVLDDLASRGAVFENAVAAAPLTQPSHASIMTGYYPTYHGVRVNGNTALAESQTTLAEVFAANGYRTGGFIGGFVLDARWGLKQGFQQYDDKFDLKKFKHLDLGAVQRPADQVVDAALAWLDGGGPGPFFAWVHLYDPHTPYEPPEPYRSEYGGRGPGGLYDGEIAFMDSQIGRLVAWLRAKGLDRTTVLLLSGDHGEGLNDHGESSHGFFIYDPTIRVPLIACVPGAFAGRRVSAPVSTVDIFSTLLDAAGLNAPPSQGRSLLPLMARPKTDDGRRVYAESMAPSLQFAWSGLRLLRSERWKYIDAPHAELYDIAADPGERTNLLYRQGEVARRLKARLEAAAAETGAGAPKPQAANLDKDTMQRLSALGYIGAPVKARAGDGPLADPKDKLAVFEAVISAGEMIVNENYAEAATRLEGALHEEPHIPQALLLLSTCYVEMNRREEAKVPLDTLLKDDPENVQALVSLANMLVDEGRTEDAVVLAKRTLSIDSKNTQADTVIGEIRMDQKRYAEALPYLEQAAEIQPKMDRFRLTLAACRMALKQYDRAEADLKSILDASPKFPLAWFNLGLLYEETGRLEDARDAYAREVEGSPNEYKAHFNLGKLLFRMGDRAGSLERMRQVVKVAPKLAEGHLMLARGLLYEPVPLAETRAEVETGLALATAPDLKALGWFLMADIHTRLGETAKVREALANAERYKKESEREN